MDDELQKAIKNANMAAGIMISLGQTLQNTQDHTRLLMDKVAAAIGVQTLQRVYVSYGCMASSCYLHGMTSHVHAHVCNVDNYNLCNAVAGSPWYA